MQEEHKKPKKVRTLPTGCFNKGKQLLESDILRAMSKTNSNNAAARYLGIHADTYKRYATMYTDQDGVTLYEKHKNQGGVGISRTRLDLHGCHTSIQVDEILNNQHMGYPLQRLRIKLVTYGYIQEKCDRCGFEENRVTDKAAPLLLAFKDEPHDYRLENLQHLCYNCYFLLIGDIVTKRNKEVIF